MNTHIDQLAQWWDGAERITDTNLPRIGDTLIFPYNADGYAIEVEEDGWTPDDVVAGESVRILARAPKPKPAWHDAVAVMARCSNAPEGHREPFIRSEATHDVWTGEGGWARTEDLRDVTPLIEAKVTDEMALRALNASTGLDLPHLTSFKRNEVEDMHFALTAALGIEAE